MGGSRRTETRNTTSNTNQNVTTPGTQGATEMFGQVQGADLMGRALGTSAFTGDRVATAQDVGTYVAQWGATPSVAVAQRSATDTPFQTTQTHVDPNFGAGIQAGLDLANAQAPSLANISSAGLGQIQTRLAGGENAGLVPMLAALRAEHDTTSARTQNQIAQAFGASGAYGGSNQGRESAWTAGEQQRAFDANAAQLIWGNYLNNQNFMMAAPELAAGYAGVGTLPAEQLLHYGGLQQENAAAAAATDDANRQIAENNMWRSLTLGDTNAQLAAENDLALRDLNYQQEDARVRNELAAAEAARTRDQAGLDNDFLRWLNEQEVLASQIGNAQGVMAIPGMIPGQTMTNQTTENSTMTARDRQPPWATAAGLLGAGMRMFAPGGFFAGSLSGLGGARNAGAGMAAGAAGAFSDRRLKKNIQHILTDWRGVKWYKYQYVDDEGKASRIGVMADELEKLAPQFVFEDESGYLKVDYSELDAWQTVGV